MAIFTATPGQEVAQANTLVANQITQYLESTDKQLNQAVLDEMMAAFRKSVTKQLMSVRDTRKGYESCTVYSGACARKSRYQYDGVPGEPILARTSLKFLLGDLVELAVIGIAQLAGVAWTDNNKDLFITGHDGVKVNAHPDGLVRNKVWYDTSVGNDIVHYNGEIKSCDSRTFDRWKDQNGPDDTWGYLTQASVEIAAWREAGYDVSSTCFVAVSTGSRQGSIAEWIIPYDQALVDAWHARRRLARGKDLPPVPFEAEMETETVRGKVLDVKYLEHGEAEQLLDKNGKAYGWKVKTGRKILPTYCGYCSYKAQCWPNAEMTVDGGKPVWVCKE